MKALAGITAMFSVTLAAPLKIMPLGDSITKGGGCESPISYRKFLADSLQLHGMDFDFVGSLTCPQDQGYDSEHQGMAGWTSGNILRGHPEAAELGTLFDWAPRFAPDIVLLHLGTNDVAQNFTPRQTLDNLSEIVGLLREANPEVRIYLARILPMLERWGMRGRALILNDSIAALASRLGAHVVDQHADIVPEEDLYDGTHPNESGYRKMAARWFAALSAKPARIGAPGAGRVRAESRDRHWQVNGREAGASPSAPAFAPAFKKNPPVR